MPNDHLEVGHLVKEAVHVCMIRFDTTERTFKAQPNAAPVSKAYPHPNTSSVKSYAAISVEVQPPPPQPAAAAAAPPLAQAAAPAAVPSSHM